MSARLGAIGAAELPSASGGGDEPAGVLPVMTEHEQSFAELLRGAPNNVCWVVTTRKVHFLPTDGAPPWCAQRKGARAKPIARFFALGDTVSGLLGLGVEGDVKLCQERVQAIAR